MKELRGDLWDYLGRAVLVITTNGSVNRHGACPMPRGCARQARERFPELPQRLGRLLREQGLRVHELGDGLVSFPVEYHWLERSDPKLIEQSARQLRKLADVRGWPLIVVPRPGCGGGGLDWAEVAPLLARYWDERFVVIAPPEEKGGAG